MKLTFAGEYRWRAGDPSSFVDIESIELKADGTYAARVEATLVNPAVRSFTFPCTLEETGQWSAYAVTGQTRIRLRPSTNKARVYVASIANGVLSLSRRGMTTTLVAAAALTFENARCA